MRPLGSGGVWRLLLLEWVAIRYGRIPDRAGNQIKGSCMEPLIFMDCLFNQMHLHLILIVVNPLGISLKKLFHPGISLHIFRCTLTLMELLFRLFP